MKLRAIKFIYFALLVVVLLVGSKKIPLDSMLNLVGKISIAQIVILLVVLCLFTFSNIFFWVNLIKSNLGRRVSWLEAFGQHAMMSLGKYLPGGVLGIVGRHHMLSKLGAGKTESVGLLFSEQILIVFSGFYIGSLALMIGLGSDYPSYSLFAAIVFAACIAFPMIFSRLVKTAAVILPNKQKYLSYLKLAPNYHINMLYAALGWLLQSALFLLLLEFLVAPNLSTQQWVLLAGLQCLSVLAGLLALFAPAGIGVREAVLVALGMIVLPKHDLLFVVVAHRLVLMFWDFVVGLFGSSLHLLFKDKAKSGSF